jgi:hypothetical protein
MYFMKIFNIFGNNIISVKVCQGITILKIIEELGCVLKIESQ